MCETFEKLLVLYLSETEWLSFKDLSHHQKQRFAISKCINRPHRLIIGLINYLSLKFHSFILIHQRCGQHKRNESLNTKTSAAIIQRLIKPLCFNELLVRNHSSLIWQDWGKIKVKVVAIYCHIFVATDTNICCHVV